MTNANGLCSDPTAFVPAAISSPASVAQKPLKQQVQATHASSVLSYWPRHGEIVRIRYYEFAIMFMNLAQKTIVEIALPCFRQSSSRTVEISSKSKACYC